MITIFFIYYFYSIENESSGKDWSEIIKSKTDNPGAKNKNGEEAYGDDDYYYEDEIPKSKKKSVIGEKGKGKNQKFLLAGGFH